MVARHVLPLFTAQRADDSRPHEAHDLGAAAYAIRAVGASVPAADAARERAWQRAQLPAAVRELVLDDQQRRSAICWYVFDD